MMIVLTGVTSDKEAYAQLGQKAKAAEYINICWKNARQYMEWYLSLSTTRLMRYEREVMTQRAIMERLIGTAEMTDKKLAERLSTEYYQLLKAYQAKGGRLEEI